MMRVEERTETLGHMREFFAAERIYKELYAACPGAFETPIYNWEEFRKRLSDGGVSARELDDAPSPIMPWLSEDFFFNAENEDVAIVKNDRYCPPFWHRLEFIKVVYVVSGSATFFTEGKRVDIGEGNLCIVPPGVLNATFSHDDRDIVINIIIKRSTFEKSFASLLSEASVLSDYLWEMLYKKNGGRVIYFKKMLDDDITEQALHIYRELNFEKKASNIMLKSYLMLFFGQMLRYYEADRRYDEKRDREDFRIADIIKYIDENKATVTLPRLAERFHFSEGYLSRRIRQETGQPFNVLLREMRIGQAAVMLCNSNVPIEEICCAVGYGDVSRFYRNFRERYGMTPAQFRRTGII